ncbi:MAG: hypothetical protein IKT09_09250 [Synergistes sp.]|nr:hypothetical protein [Synergistes sp.]
MKKKRNLGALILVAALFLNLWTVPMLFAAAEPETKGSGAPHAKENGDKYRFSFVDYDKYMPASRQFYYILTGLEKSGWIAAGSLPFTIAEIEARQLSTAQMYDALEQADLGPYIAFAEGAFYDVCNEDKTDIASDLKSRAGKDIDLVITFGTNAGVFVKNLGLPIPMTDFSATDPVASGIIDSATTGSGNPNVWAHVEPSLPLRQLKYYHSIRPFTKLGLIVYGDEIISGVPDIEASAREIGFELVKYNIAEQPRETAEELDSYYELVRRQLQSMARENIDAFFLTVDLINDLSRMQDLLKPLYDKRVPVYLMDDVEALRHGALMLINAYDLVNVGRFVANAIVQILNGAEAGSLPCVYTSAPGIYVNFDVAKRIGYTLDFEFLTACDEIYTERGYREGQK